MVDAVDRQSRGRDSPDDLRRRRFTAAPRLVRGAGVTLAIIALLGGCGGGGGNGHVSKISHLGGTTIRVGTTTVTTRTRTVGGKTETLFIHRGPVSSANTRHIVTRKLPHVGIVLVNGKGYALYAFTPDKPGQTCSGSCAVTWPPIRLNIEMAIDSSPALDESLVTTEPDPEHHAVGDRVVKFGGFVVHSYTGDPSPGVAEGEGLASYGGHWHAISPSGKPILSKH